MCVCGVCTVYAHGHGVVCGVVDKITEYCDTLVDRELGIILFYDTLKIQIVLD